MNEPVRVALGDRSYDARVGQGLLARAGELIAPFAPSGRVFIVTDRTLAKLHLAKLHAALEAANLLHETITIAPGESQKSFRGLERVCRALLQAGINRNDLVVAFGGGVIGDLAGLAAGLVKRGVDFVQIPTTLLAQVDSSVGGKTAIDTRAGKNLVGLFYQPRLVLADLDVLGTLPVREMRAGYAEIVKYGLIDMAEFFTWCEANGEKIIAGDRAALAHAVGVSVKAKARIVAEDERESGARALLNLGHTFAHALETQAGYGDALLHGEAVAVGLALAYAMSARLGLASEADAARVRRHLEALGYTVDLTRLPGGPYAADLLLSHMGQDKKNQDGKLTLILSRGIGGAFVNKDADAGAVRAFLADELAA